MNKLKTFPLFATFASLFASLFGSCASEELVSRTNKVQHIATSGTTIQTNNQLELNKLANVIASESDIITIIKDAEIVDLTDSRGSFRAISFKYSSGGRVVSMIVPLAEPVGIKSSDLIISDEGCVMKFYGSQACAYEIVERCKTLEVSGVGNSASVSFTNRAVVP